MASLFDLPKEILFLITDFVGPIDTKNLKQTCCYLNNLFSDQYYWEHYARTYIKGTFPPIRPSSENKRYCWESSLCNYIYEKTIWSKFENIHCVSLENVHSAAVDAVILLKNSQLCMTGSRDRTLALWNVPRSLKGDKNPYAVKTNTHRGWIWDLCQNVNNNHVYSASWDQTVKIWDIDNNIKHLDTFKCTKTALSVDLTECNLIAVGLCTGTMQLFDPLSCRLVASYNVHKTPILKMATSQNLIYTISQDKKIGVFDLRTWQALKGKVMPKSLPLSLSVCSNYLYVGDSSGNLHLFDTQTFSKIASYNLISTGRKKHITGIKHHAGSIIITSADGYVRIFTLTHPPKLIQKYLINGEAISLDYKNRVIAVGRANNALNLLAHNLHPFFN